MARKTRVPIFVAPHMQQVSCWRAWLVCLGRRLTQIKEFLDGSAMLSLPGQQRSQCDKAPGAPRYLRPAGKPVIDRDGAGGRLS